MKPVDEGLAPVRAVRHAISREFRHEAGRYVSHLRTIQTRYTKQVAAFRRGRKSKQLTPAVAS